ncbi:hypothetical protein WQ54_05530 [Bacillus sp. SA1-12]|uniref:DUF3231 family protein n=1 Tax=Bacillus sp. SA1-12 TaxID=1455638 RepID=UPI000626A7B2|nr:DUF3231 family protein [Bacillus sp. SA1-12]KKI93289.1 hypothetical protein WQ54_05530 [Bacillus sp. SA1-12]
MKTIKPKKLSSSRADLNQKLTSAEMGKLWATYMGNSMSKCVLKYFLQHVEDEEIKALVEHALALSEEIFQAITDIFEKEDFPLPIGFTDNDVNLGAPRLFEDPFYVHYLKYAAKAGMSLYNVAVPLVYRRDVRDLYLFCMNKTMELMEQIKDLLMNKGLIIKPPLIPVPDKAEFVHKDFLNGFFGHVRPLHALEIAHFYDNIENNVTSRALIMAFSQVAKSNKIRDWLIRGMEITTKTIQNYMEELQDENLPAPSFLDHLVTTSTNAPFSDKLMIFHKVDMFSMKIRAFGNSVAVNGRHDIGMIYTKSLINTSLYVDEGAKIMIEKGWFEKPPHAADREELRSE